ncbi:fibulin-2-like isoform X2 [Schistocerca cancellata]|uniref:fibulin-2-like isoform X2 n=1 Tax=Schistocerca cancellata TaxID=274614 RepID=UPI00211931E6|nr:fibulin-2-like isoform X2 [Schistocerca cancellata]
MIVKRHFLNVAMIFILCYLDMAKGKRIGENCMFDEECDSGVTYCRDRSTCDCKPGFRNQQSSCIATIDSVCLTDSDCNTLSFSSCQDNFCMCRQDYVPSSSRQACLPVATGYKQQCEENTQCSKTFGDSAYCYGGQCVCSKNYHFADRKCIRNKDLDNQCNSSSECYIGENLGYRVSCQSNRCRCNEGYIKKDNTCIDSATTSALSFLLVAFHLLVVFLF